MNKNKILLGVIAKDETCALRELLPKVINMAEQIGIDLLVIDNGSSDNTAEVARSFGIETVVFEEGGLSQGLRYILKLAQDRNYDFCLHMDGDGQHDPDALAYVSYALTQGGDMAICSRFHKLSFVVGTVPADRLLLNGAVVGMTSRLGLPYSDPLCGMRGYSRKTVDFLLAQEYATDLCNDSYGFILESLLRVWQEGSLKIMELPHPAIYAGCGKISTIYEDEFLPKRLERFQMHAGHILAVMNSLSWEA